LLDKPASTAASMAFPSRPHSAAQRATTPRGTFKHARDIRLFDANVAAAHDDTSGTPSCMPASPPTHGFDGHVVLARRPATAPQASQPSTTRARASARGATDDRSDSPRKMYLVHDTPADILRSKRRLAEFIDRLHPSSGRNNGAVNRVDVPALSVDFHPT
jgi:hypothetical protein